MFLGYQDDFISLIAETRKELEKSSCISFTKIEETSEPVEKINNTYYVGKETIINAKQENVRNYRNNLLAKYVDPIVSNVLRWEEMGNYEKTCIKNYRAYLLDYTDGEKWWEEYPKTFEEFNYTDMILGNKEKAGEQ